MTKEKETESKALRTLRLSRAWKRLFLGEDGGLHNDGRQILQDLLRKADFFGVQYEPGNHDATLIKAVKRSFVIDILAQLSIDEAQIQQLIRITQDD